jgi:hypothetical protein
LPLSQIESGMILAADVKAKTGLLLMAHGQQVSDALLQRMKLSRQSWSCRTDPL